MVLAGVLLEADTELLMVQRTKALAPDSPFSVRSVLRDQLQAAIPAGLWARPGLTIGQLAAALNISDSF